MGMGMGDEGQVPQKSSRRLSVAVKCGIFRSVWVTFLSPTGRGARFLDFFLALTVTALSAALKTQTQEVNSFR